MPTAFAIGIDVGTGSARAGVFDLAGQLLASARRPIDIWHEPGDIVEQSADQIWSAVVAATREAIAAAGVAPPDIAGIGFDATCSLVAVRADGTPVTVSRSNDPARNVIVWMDHRATAEAAAINAGDHAVLAYVGGRISPEMETPKLLWLRRNLPEAYAAADYFFDLADYLTWRATGSQARSVCTVTCKWTYLAHENRWDPGYFTAIGLEDLAQQEFARIGTDIVPPGTALAQGLSLKAAADLGLVPGTPVGAGLIDAHAGGLGTLGGRSGDAPADITGRLAYIFGTSACSMASTASPVFVNGVWGPYFAAMAPGLWLNEGGQSAAGAALDRLVAMHPAAPEATRLAAAAGAQSLIAWLDSRATTRAGTADQAVMLARGLHVVPEFLGNRSPFADPEARAVIAGLGMEDGTDDLVNLYVAGLCGIGYGLRQLVDRFRVDGIAIDLIVASGGASQSPLVQQVLADCTGIPVAIAATPEPVLLGAAMLGAAAADPARTLASVMAAMSRDLAVVRPAAGPVGELHRQRFRAFEQLQATARDIREAD